MEKTNFEQHDFQNIVVYVINGSWAIMISKLYLLIPKIDLQFLFWKRDGQCKYIKYTYLALLNDKTLLN